MATRNRYAEIMAQYAQSQPYSFFGYPQSYTGGYDVSQPQAYAAPATRYEEIMAQPAMRSGGRGTPDEGGGTFVEPTSEQAYNWSQAGKNLRFISPLLGGLAGWYGNYLARNVDPNYSHEGRNYAAPTGGFVSAAPAQADTSNYSNEGRNYSVPTGGRPYGTGPVPPGISENDFYAAEAAFAQPAETKSLLSRYPAQVSAADAAAAAASAAAAAQAAAQGDTSNYSNEGRGGGGGNSGGGGGVATGGNNGDASGGGDRGTRGGFAQGGHVSMMHLQGPNPMGPDDGYGALKDGEYVINDKAVKKYGIELMNAINTGKISKGKLRGLLEM
jgi:hypothetical protein